MFQEIINRLNAVNRIDLVANSSDVRFTSFEDDKGEHRLSVGVRGDDMRLEEQGEASLLRQWGVPRTFFGKLSPDLKIKTLTHIAGTDSKDLMFRTVQTGSDAPVVRGVVSGSYAPLDNAPLIQAIEPYLAGWDVSPIVQRDQMAIYARLPRAYDVSERQVGDFVRAGVVISNNELGYGAAEVSYTTYRLVCKNGMLAGDMAKARQIHRFTTLANFLEKLRTLVSEAGIAGEVLARRMRSAHRFVMTSLNEDGEKMQRQIIGILRAAGLWNHTLRDEVNAALGRDEEASLFGVVQALSSEARLANEPFEVRMSRQESAGRVLALVE